MRPLHVLIGTAQNDIATLEECARTNLPVTWIVPKSAAPQDDVMFFVWGHGMVATGKTTTPPKLETDGKWAKRYRAKVAEITLIDPPLSEDQLSQTIPFWAWLRYPKMYTTPATEIADALRHLAASSVCVPDIDLMEATEGDAHLEEHLAIERDPKLVEAKKRAVLAATGALACEVCGFDFRKRYGHRGNGYCEVHHLLPFSGIVGNRVTKLEDLAILCSNCHRVIHRGPLMALGELRASLLADGA